MAMIWVTPVLRIKIAALVISTTRRKVMKEVKMEPEQPPPIVQQPLMKSNQPSSKTKS